LIYLKIFNHKGWILNHYRYICSDIAYFSTFMDDIYILADNVIQQRIGEKIKKLRLKQNITQKNLSDISNVSLSTIKKVERGEISSFDSLLRILRILGKLDIFQPLIEEEQLSPNEYYELMKSAKKRQRKRAVSKYNKSQMEDSEW